MANVNINSAVQKQNPQIVLGMHILFLFSPLIHILILRFILGIANDTEVSLISVITNLGPLDYLFLILFPLLGLVLIKIKKQYKIFLGFFLGMIFIHIFIILFENPFQNFLIGPFFHISAILNIITVGLGYIQLNHFHFWKKEEFHFPTYQDLTKFDIKVIVSHHNEFPGTLLSMTQKEILILMAQPFSSKFFKKHDLVSIRFPGFTRVIVKGRLVHDEGPKLYFTIEPLSRKEKFQFQEFSRRLEKLSSMGDPV